MGGCCLVACLLIPLPLPPKFLKHPLRLFPLPWFCRVKETGTSGAVSPGTLKPISLGPLHASIQAPWDSITLLP